MRNATSALAAALILAGCSPGTIDAQQAAGTHRLDGERVAVYNLAGRVTIEGGSGADVTVSVTPGGADGGLLQAVSGSIDGRETLRVIYPDDRIVYRAGESQQTQLRVRSDGTFGGDDGRDRWRRVVVASDGAGSEAWADLTIMVPAGRDVAVHHAVGAVVVRNVDGTLLVDTHSAGVEASGTRGSLLVDVGSGDVSVRDAQGRLLVDAGSGNVVVEGSTGDEVLIDTGSGNVAARGLSAGRILIDTGSGSVTLALASDVSELSVDTGSGDVTVRAPRSLGARLEVETGSGDIESDFAITATRRGRNELSGTLGDGQGRIVIDTGSGDVRLLAAD